MSGFRLYLTYFQQIFALFRNVMLLRFLEILSKKVQPNCSKDQGGEGGLVMQGVPNHMQYPYLKIMRLAVFFKITNILVAFVTNMRHGHFDIKLT